MKSAEVVTLSGNIMTMMINIHIYIAIWAERAKLSFLSDSDVFEEDFGVIEVNHRFSRSARRPVLRH
jgi:hypothetical protein